MLLKKIKLGLSLATLGNSLLDKLRLFILVFIPFLNKKLGWKSGEIKLRLKKNNFVFDLNLKGEHDEILILQEIMKEEEYKLDLQTDKVKLILDIGANIGVSVLYFLAFYRQAIIHAFEPEKQVYDQLKKNILSGANSIYIHKIAIGESDGTENLYVNKDRSLASSLKKRIGQNITENVEIRTLDTILSELNGQSIDILKFDVEGGEWMIFKNFKNWNKINNIIGELHFDLLSLEEKNSLVSLLEKYFECDYYPTGKKERYLLKGKRKV